MNAKISKNDAIALDEYLFLVVGPQCGRTKVIFVFLRTLLQCSIGIVATVVVGGGIAEYRIEAIAPEYVG